MFSALIFHGRLGRPEPERVYRPSAIADDRRVVCHSVDLFGRDPLEYVASVLPDHLDLATEVDGVGQVAPLDLPWIAILEPVVRLLDLPAVPDLLVEDSVVVSDSIAICRNLERRETVEEAGGQTTESSVAKPCIRLLVDEVLQLVAEGRKRLPDRLLESEVDDVVRHRPAHQELKREVVHPLGALGALRLAGQVPLMDDPVPDGHGQCLVACLLGGMVYVCVECVLELLCEILGDVLRGMSVSRTRFCCHIASCLSIEI